MIPNLGSLDHVLRKHLLQPMTKQQAFWSTSEKKPKRERTQNDLKVHLHGSPTNGTFSREAAFFRESEEL